MGRVDTQLIGFLLLLLASVTRVKQIHESFFISSETPLCVAIFDLPGIGEGEVTQRGANLERVEMVCVFFISSAFCQCLLCSQHIFLYSPNHFEPILLVLRLASATPMSLWSSNLAMRSSSIQTSSTHLPRFQLCSRYSSFLLQSQYVVMLFPSPWIFFAATLPPSADPVPPSTNKNRPMLTQYHHSSTSTAFY